jgi:hypothetical protein
LVVSPDAGEAGHRAGLVEREPDVAALGLVELAERVEGHHAAVLRTQPSRPVFARHVADVGGAGVRLHPEQLLEVDRLALGFELRGAFLGRFHQGVLRRWHAPARGRKLAAVCAGTHDRRLVVRKHAGHRREIADVPIDDPKQRDDGGLVGRDRVEVMPTSA